jgi:esterase/lipase
MNELLKDLEPTRENALILAHHDKGSMLTKEYDILAAAGLAMGGIIHGFGLLIYHYPPKKQRRS